MLYVRYELNFRNYVIQITFSLQDLKHVKDVVDLIMQFPREYRHSPGHAISDFRNFKKNTRLNIK